MHIPLHRCLVTLVFCDSTSRSFGLVCSLWLWYFPDHANLFLLTFVILIHILIKIQQKGGIGVILQFLEHKSFGILTRTVWSVVVGHVVLAIHIVHSLETNRAGTISRQIIVLSEHLFTLKGKWTWNIPILYCNSLDYAYFVSLPHSIMPGWPAV